MNGYITIMVWKKKGYKEYINPANLYQLEIPRHWEIKVDEHRTTFYDPKHGSGALQVTIYMRRNDTQESSDHPVTQMESFLKMRKIPFSPDKIQKLSIQQHHAAYHEFFDSSESKGVLKEVFWRLWFVVSDKLLAFITYNCDKKYYQREYLTVTRIANSLKLASKVPLLMDVFLEKLFSVIHDKFPDIKISPVNTFCLLINDVMVNVTDLYRSCILNPDKQESLIYDFIKSFAFSPRLVINSFDQIKTKVFPQVKPTDFFRDPLTMSLPKIPLIDFLEICFVYEDGKMLRFLNDNILEKIDVSLKQVYAVSLENLKNSTMSMKMNYGSFHDIAFINIQSSDGLAAARILLPDFYKNVSTHLGKEFLIGIPFRDFLIAFEKKESSGNLPRFIEKIKEDYMKQSHPITYRILRMDSRGITEFTV